MKKINKQNKVPESLDCETTKERRNEIISVGKYPTAKNISDFPTKKVDSYNIRYKQKDIKSALNAIYKGKCAYCETKNRQLAVEHFRPKNYYYWLAYSWDNLLYCCPICNSRKSNKFPIENTKVRYNHDDINQIHQLTAKYDRLEQPKLINPETVDIFNDIIYTKRGEFDIEKISNQNLLATIDVLKLNENDLSESRKAVYDRIEKDITEIIYEIKQGYKIEQNKIRIEQIILSFIKDIDN